MKINNKLNWFVCVSVKLRPFDCFFFFPDFLSPLNHSAKIQVFVFWIGCVIHTEDEKKHMYTYAWLWSMNPHKPKVITTNLNWQAITVPMPLNSCCDEYSVFSHAMCPQDCFHCVHNEYKFLVIDEILHIYPTNALCKQYGIDHKNLTHFEKKRKKCVLFEYCVSPPERFNTHTRMPWAINHPIVCVYAQAMLYATMIRFHFSSCRIIFWFVILSFTQLASDFQSFYLILVMIFIETTYTQSGKKGVEKRGEHMW